LARSAEGEGFTDTFTAELWLHPGVAGWHFVTLPTDLADQLCAQTAATPRAFGSLPVAATIGHTTWTTSLFVDTKAASYLLPVKADVRRRERLTAGDSVRVTVELQPLAAAPRARVRVPF
jgi:hypothetical protein